MTRSALGPDASDRTDFLYALRWRRTLLVVIPLAFLATLAAWSLGGLGGQHTRLDAVAYPAIAVSLAVAWGALASSHRALRLVLVAITAGMSAYFAAKLIWLLFAADPGVPVHGEMTESFFWIPVVYLLSFIQPEIRVGRLIASAFTVAVGVASVVYVVPHSLAGADWGAIGALVQLNLANATFLALTSAFTRFREAYARTQARMEATERAVNTDALTSLPNRHRLERHLDARFASARRAGERFALLFLDLDGFKGVNDTLGHAGGDELLKGVAGRLGAVVRGSDLVARISGDEFVLVLDRIDAPDDADVVARRVVEALAAPFEVRGHRLHVSLSVGIAAFPDDGEDADTLLRHADSAMYRVKRGGRNGIEHYRGGVDASLERERTLERDLREAVRRDELTLVYQSLHDLGTGEARGVEALLRWRHPGLGPVSPAEFVPIAERSGLIVDIGAWVLNEACRQAKVWEARGLGGLTMSVNVSPLQFSHPGFVDTVLEALARHGVPPERLQLEITETVVLQDVDRVAATLVRLQRMGIRIAMDDFGTGYSCLAYLRDLPIDTVKIDRSFVRDLGVDGFAAALVGAIVGLASQLDLEVVAEGVETPEQCAAVARLGCRTGQGYRFSRPMPPDEVERLLARWVPPTCACAREAVPA